MPAVYDVTFGSPALHGSVIGDWESAAVARIDRYPWGGGGCDTEARVLVDEDGLSVQFRCDDDPSAEVTQLNGPVSTDACAEWFVSAGGDEYVNVEINSLGTLLVGVGPSRTNRRLIDEELAERLTVRTGDGGGASESGWWVAARLPFDVLEEVAGFEPPEPGDRWIGNFYRTTGDGTFGVWCSPRTESPDFHRPSAFGALRFADALGPLGEG